MTMNGFRRHAAIAMMAMAALASIFAGQNVRAAEKENAGELVYIGMHGTQIHAARFDIKSGDMTMIGPVADNPRPTWAVMHPDKPIVYFDDNSGEEGKSEGGVQTLRINARTGTLTQIGNMRAGGAGTTHLWLDRPSMTMLAANYSGGSISSMRILKDGTLGKPASVIKLTGSGPHRRQASPHAHGITVDPSGKFALVADLGSDRIFVFPFDRKTGTLGQDDPANSRHYVVTAGSGPRHLAFHPDGRTLYLINELTADIEVLDWNAKSGRMKLIQKLATNAPGFAGTTSAAEIAVSADGRFVYSSNRGDHTLVVHSVDSRTHKLSQIQRISSGGLLPWHFVLHKSGKWMLVSNRDSESLNLFVVDKKTGMLSNSGKSLKTPNPVFAIFAGGRR